MIRKLILAALVALVAAPLFSLHHAALSVPHPAAMLDGIGGARVVSVGSLLSTGLI